MKIIEPSVTILDEIDATKILRKLEMAGRTCYKSEDKITEDSAGKFLANCLKRGHESLIEHQSISVRFVCDRGVTHEIVRHRIASFSQESTRYANYSLGKFGGEITVIRPCYWQEGSPQHEMWKKACENAETAYLELLKNGATAQEARSVLPNSLKTELVMTANIREWRHFFRLRTEKASHPQMVQVARMLLKKFRERIPVVFDDVGVLDD